MTTEHGPQHPDETGIEALLRKVGSRGEPSPDVTDSVRAAVYSEWQAMLGERRRHRRQRFGALAASVAILVVLASLVLRQQWPASAVQVATVTQIDGRLLTAENSAEWLASAAHRPILAGESVRTDADSRAALTFGQNVSVRLDRQTTVRAIAPDRIELGSGALYVDAPAGSSGDVPLIVQTRAGPVQHVGTQYEVRSHADVVQVSVREGRVTFADVHGRAGERISIGAAGEVTRTTLSPTDPAWDWAVEVAPRFDIDNQSLASFLAWVARETGRRIVYASPEAQAESNSVRLKGSIADLDPGSALAAVLSTTQLTQYDTGDDTLIGIALSDSEVLPPDRR